MNSCAELNICGARDYLVHIEAAPLCLGTIDCVSFSAGLLEAGFGLDYGASLGYFGRRGAVDRLRRAGGLRAAVGAILGTELPIRQLRVGDVAYFDGPPPTIGVVMPGYIAVKSHRNIHRYRIDSATTGWTHWAPQ